MVCKEPAVAITRGCALGNWPLQV